MTATLTELNILEAQLEETYASVKASFEESSLSVDVSLQDIELSCVLSELMIDDLIYVKYNGDTVTYLGMPIVIGKEEEIA